MKTPMRHLVIFLPGIMGSVLQRDGQDVWALSGQALGHYLRTRGNSLQLLRIENEDCQYDDVGDGVQATRLIEDIFSVPFVIEHSGYSVFIRRLTDHFALTTGSSLAPRNDANFYTFPYDWRLDNRISARKLQRFIQDQLPRWRNHSGAKDAKVILIGHSMGGLISRYYLEVLEGWRYCEAVITIGSPHRGAVNALDALSNRFKGLFGNLGLVTGTFTSMYQILPTYPMVATPSGYARIAEASSIPNLDQARAEAARSHFLEAIRLAALENKKLPDYQQLTMPWVGTRHKTRQSARVENGILVADYAPSRGLDPTLADGDGTVPRISAIPSDLDGQRWEHFSPERHGWLTNNVITAKPLLDTLTKIAAQSSKNLHGDPVAELATISLRLESLYTSDDAKAVGLQLSEANQRPLNVVVEVADLSEPTQVLTQTIQVNGDSETEVEFSGLPVGLYRLMARPKMVGGQAPQPAYGLFEVADSAGID